MYELFVSVCLGIIQGITEFLPISSTAHLRVFASFFSSGGDIGLEASNFIQFGTLLAILTFYKIELGIIFNNIKLNLTNFRQFQRFLLNTTNWLKGVKSLNLSVKDKYDIIISQLFFATIPLVFVALIFRKIVEQLRADILNIAIFLVLGGVLVGACEIVYYIRKKTNKSTADSLLSLKNEEGSESSVFNLKQVMIIGLFQSLAVFPGVSRSGATLAGALLTGKNRKDGVYFSFLLSIPAILLVSIYDLFKILIEVTKGDINILPILSGLNYVESGVFSLSVLSLIAGLLSAYFVGLLCLKWLLKFLSTNDSKVFLIYRIIFALLITFIAYR